MLRAALPQIDRTVTDEYLGIYHPVTFRAQATSDFMKDVVTNRLLSNDIYGLIFYIYGLILLRMIARGT